MDCAEPCNKRDMGVLKDRADFDRELLSASATLPYAGPDRMLGFRLASQSVRFTNHAAMRANGALRPAQFLDKPTCRIFRAATLGQFIEVHGFAPMQFFFYKPIGCVKYVIPKKNIETLRDSTLALLLDEGGTIKMSQYGTELALTVSHQCSPRADSQR
jgi:hypothetical protein